MEFTSEPKRRSSGSSSSDSGIGSMPEIPEAQRPDRPGCLDPEIKKALRALLEMLLRIPESLHFRHNPTQDPCKLAGRCLSQYKHQIQHKMYLDKISEKLEDDKYDDPWEYIDDMHLIVQNAQAYNSQGTKVYNYSVQFLKIFEAEMDRLMRQHGYCCGQRQVITPQKLVCLGKENCMIRVDGFFFTYQNKYLYCESCFKRIPGDKVSLANDSKKASASIVDKSEFSRTKNAEEEKEPFVRCTSCSRTFHQKCVLYVKEISPKGFCCENCFWQNNKERRERAFTAKSLSPSKLGCFIEKKVNDFLVGNVEKGKEICYVTVRVVGSFERAVEVKPELKQLYPDKFSRNFPYKAKTIFVFQRIEGVDVCVLAFMVQEYGSDCPEPNCRRVYLSYLDSVQFFRPKELRTTTFHQILLSYFEYVKTLGFLMVHIWSCPPTDDDDYIFHRHPRHQKVPTRKRLCEWYRTLLDKGIEEGVLVEYKSYQEQVQDNSLTSITEMPYFDGDHWPLKFEEMIKESKKERGQKRSESCMSMKAVPRKRNKTSDGERSKSHPPSTASFEDHLWKKVCKEMTTHKDIFFNVRLQPIEYELTEMIIDPDVPQPCALMENRDQLLSLARDNRYEFTTLRRAKYLTLVILYNLHRLAESNYMYSCSVCDEDITLDKRYHCSECEIDFCIDCFSQADCCSTCDGSCEKVGFGEDEGQRGGVRQASLKESLDTLEHAVNCTYEYKYCKRAGCLKMRMTLQHLRKCSGEDSFAPIHCSFCLDTVRLIYQHVLQCPRVRCGILLCGNIKLSLRLGESPCVLDPVEPSAKRTCSWSSCST